MRKKNRIAVKTNLLKDTVIKNIKEKIEYKE